MRLPRWSLAVISARQRRRHRRPPLKKRREEMSRHAAPDVVGMYEVVCCCHIAVLDLSSVFIPREPTRAVRGLLLLGL